MLKLLMFFYSSTAPSRKIRQPSPTNKSLQDTDCRTAAHTFCRSICVSAACLIGISLSTQALSDECLDERTQNPIYGADCQFISLKEDPGNSNSRTIDVYLTRIPAIQDDQKPPVFFIAGGPGQASSELVAMFRHQFSHLLVDHDFVFVDQRGTGKSNPLDCDVDLLEHADKTLNALEELALEKQRECLKTYDGDLTRYTTPYAVQDLEAVRKHLGYDKVFLWGGSYGTRVIIEYLRSFPSAIAGAILDGVAPVSIQLPAFVERDGSRALDRLFEVCHSDAACEKAFPNLSAHWLTLLDTLQSKPSIVTLTHPRTQKSHRIYIDDQIVSAWTRIILYSREITPILPLALYRATQNDYSQLFSIYALGLDNLSEGISEGLQTAILCAEDRQFSLLNTQNKPDSYARLLHLPTPKSFDRICEMFPKSILDANYFETIRSDVPTLLLSGKLDPVTPALWADKLSPQLSNSRHIIVEGGHHIVSRLGCMPRIIAKFIKAPNTLNTIEIECVDQIKTPHFFIDSAGPALSTEPKLPTDIQLPAEHTLKAAATTAKTTEAAQ